MRTVLSCRQGSETTTLKIDRSIPQDISGALGYSYLRMAALGFGWANLTATQVYTIFDIRPLLADEFVRRRAIPGGLNWHFARPPVQGLDFEVDVRGVAHELVI
jgi:hypothetical protein